MTNIIGTFNTVNSRSGPESLITFIVYDNYTYSVSGWPKDKFTDFKIVENTVYVKHRKDSNFTKIDSSREDYILFTENILMIVAEHEMLTGE